MFVKNAILFSLNDKFSLKNSILTFIYQTYCYSISLKKLS